MTDAPPATSRECPACGAPLASEAGGLCPRCLLRGMLAGAPPREDDWAAEAGYLVLEKIGEGGMGEVFLAEQYAPLRREVALKRLKPGLDAVEWLRRFSLEREALARLDHPHIARVLDAGVAADGRPFYAMELIDGLPLTLFCDRRRLALEGRLRLFATVCDAVQHAHQKGVIHGDLKPSNILVATDDTGAPDPRLIDFGVLRTATAMGVFGTPGYASPDTALDARSDVFSLGALLREMAVPEPRWMRADVEWIVRRATQPSPEARYAAASDLAAEVRRLLVCRAVAAAPGGVAYRAKRFARRHARALAVWGVAGALLLAGASLGVHHLIIVRGAKIAIAESRRRAGIGEMRGALTTELVYRLAGALAEPDPAQREGQLHGFLDHFRHQLDATRERLEPEAQFSLRQTLAAALQGLGRHREAEQELLEARRLLARMPGFAQGDRRARIIDRDLARARAGQHRIDEAEKDFQTLLASAVEREERRVLLSDLASLYFHARRFDEAERPAAEAAALADDPRERWETQQLVAKLHVEQRRYREARTLLREIAGALPPGHPRTAEVQAQLAEVEAVLEKMEER